MKTSVESVISLICITSAFLPLIRCQSLGHRIDPPPVGPDPRFRARGGNQVFVSRAPNSRVSWAMNHTRVDDPLGIINEAANFFARSAEGFNTGSSFFPPQPPPRPSNRIPVNDWRLPSPASFRPSVERRRFEEPPVVNNNFENFGPGRRNNFRNNIDNSFNAPPINNNNFRPPVNRNISPRLLDPPPRNFTRPSISGSAVFNGPFIPNRQPVRNQEPRLSPPPLVNREPPPRQPVPPINNERAVAPVHNNGPNIVPSQCLRCMCAASTGCDLKRGCVGDFCGPFLISWNYWSDAGRPGKDFISCALNLVCAEDTIQGYMRKWTRDCNGDGIVDCDDFAAIHKLGPNQCRSDSVTSTPYWREFEKCDSAVRRPSSSPSHLGSPSFAVGDLRRPDRRFNDIPILPDHERRSPPPPSSSSPAASDFPDHRNNNAANFHTISRNNNANHRSFPPAPFFFNNDASPVTTVRPPLDLPLITPRRRLYPPSAVLTAENPGAVVREGRSNDVVGGGNLIDSGKPIRQELTKECMDCICEASSGCNLQSTCPLDGGPTHHMPKTCGAYQFDRNYWTLSGRPGRSFESCANEKSCSEETVGRYTHQMAFDCNEDGVIDCLDYASIHRVGPKSCNTQWLLESPYWQSFEQCYGFGR